MPNDVLMRNAYNIADLREIARRRLPKGSYTAKVTAGGKSHSVSFVVH